MKICIEGNEDGTYTVSDETMEESQEPEQNPSSYQQAEGAQTMPMSAGEQQPQGQMANSLEEALKLVVRMFQDQAGGMKANPFERGMKEGLGQK